MRPKFSDTPSEFDRFCETLNNLRVDRSRGLVKPYKPLLVAAVVVLIHKGKIRSPDVYLDGALQSTFFQLLAKLFPSWPTKAKAEYPFRHLETDGIWTLQPVAGRADALSAAKARRQEAWDVLAYVECARLPETVFARLAASFEARFRVIHTLAAKWFDASQRASLMDFLAYHDDYAVPLPAVADADDFTERALEEHLERHWAQTPFAAEGVELADVERHGLRARQQFTSVNSIDLLGYQPEEKCWWVFELKRGPSSDKVVGQVSRYLGWIEDRHCSNGRTATGAIIVPRVDEKLRVAVLPHREKLSIWVYDQALRVRRAA